MLVKELIEQLSKLNPDEPLWVTYLTKEDIKATFKDIEYEDINGNLIDTESLVTNSVVEEIADELTNDDYVWERFYETLTESCKSIASRLLEQEESDKDLWE